MLTEIDLQTIRLSGAILRHEEAFNGAVDAVKQLGAEIEALRAQLKAKEKEIADLTEALTLAEKTADELSIKLAYGEQPEMPF